MNLFRCVSPEGVITISYKIRQTERQDAPLILTFIKELAAYEKLAHEVTGTKEDIEETLFGDHPKAEALILEVDEEPAGFALFFHNYSTFLCKPGLYIEDIYVREEYRGKGYGIRFFNHLCAIAKQRNCGRVEWWCLDDNKPSIDFYKKLGAEAMDAWTVFRLGREKIEELG